MIPRRRSQQRKTAGLIHPRSCASPGRSRRRWPDPRRFVALRGPRGRPRCTESRRGEDPRRPGRASPRRPPRGLPKPIPGGHDDRRGGSEGAGGAPTCRVSGLRRPAMPRGWLSSPRWDTRRRSKCSPTSGRDTVDQLRGETPQHPAVTERVKEGDGRLRAHSLRTMAHGVRRPAWWSSGADAWSHGCSAIHPSGTSIRDHHA